MHNTGMIFANDSNQQRCKAITGNLHRLGVSNTVITCMDGRHYPKVSDVMCLKSALGSDKVSMLTSTYSHKPLGKIKVAICNRQVDKSSKLVVMSDIRFVIIDKEYGHTWHQMPLLWPGVIK